MRPLFANIGAVHTMSEQLKPGTHLGAYEILSFIASGGMGSVYKARNRILGDFRAIKVILPSLSSNEEFVGRFVREAQLASRIQHPNVVKMLEPAMDGNTMFLPMELLEGESLSDLLKREAPLHPVSAIDLVRSTGAGIAALHAAGIIHRDLKPANIFLNRENGVIVPKVLDFGAARLIQYDGEQTNTGQVIGSAHYMPLEQASGRKDIDERVDQYALAVMLYLMLSRRRPYENDDMGVALAKIIQGLPYPNVREIAPWVPAELAAVVHRALARDRENRFPSINEFCAALLGVRQAATSVQMPQDLIQRHATPIASSSQPSVPFIASGGSDSRSAAPVAPIGFGDSMDPSQQTILPQELDPLGQNAARQKSMTISLVVILLSVAVISFVVAAAIGMRKRDPHTAPSDQTSSAANQTNVGAVPRQDPLTASESQQNNGQNANSGTTANAAGLADANDAGVLEQANNGANSGTPTVGTRTNVRTTNNNRRTPPPPPTRTGGCVPRPGIPCL